MPLLDHFHPPLAPRRHWESFHVNWAGAIADALNETLLPEGYFAEEHAQLGPMVEIDVATFADAERSAQRAGGTVAVIPRTWAPPAPSMVMPCAFPDAFEVLVFESEGGARLVAAIELVSPGNKDREAHRRAFAIKCASYLCRGVGLIVIDIVTSRRANLHAEIVRTLGQGDAFALAEETLLYGIAYRPIVREEQSQIEMWPSPLEIGRPLPVLPLALNAEVLLPIDLEATYTIACQRRRLV
jgi:sugar/nucleoside kinase (ribokinase family)